MQMRTDVDPFLGCEATNMPPSTGLSGRWFMPKARVGNTHPGACLPFDPISVLPYSGAYPTGYGPYRENTEGLPRPRFSGYYASGFTHIHHSGPGRIRAYYNYLRVTPHIGSLAVIGKRWALADEQASPGRYRCQLVGTGIRAELTCAPMAAIHRYTFPSTEVALLAIDWALGGIDENDKRTPPSRVNLQLGEDGCASGMVEFDGVPLYVALHCDMPNATTGCWYDRQPVAARALALDGIDPVYLRPFGTYHTGAVNSGQQVTLRLAFSFRSHERARARLAATPGTFDEAVKQAEAAWDETLDRITVQGATADQQTQLATAHYHSCIKPALAQDESPWWGDGPYAFDFSTIWDQYKTQLPLLYLLHREAGEQVVGSLAKAAEVHGRIPICYLLSSDFDRFANQASALGELTLAEASRKGVGGVDWPSVLPLLAKTMCTSGAGPDFVSKQLATPFTHHLDLADAHAAMAAACAKHGLQELAAELSERATLWPAAYDPQTGLLDATNTYEGGVWNYSFRLQHAMRERVELAGGDEAFLTLLDSFFGYGREIVEQLAYKPYGDLWHKGIASCTFEGLNNEPDMETPWAYCYAGRHDRTCEVVHTVLRDQFGLGRGGLPGNDDSGALSSWYLWASLGLFPVAGADHYLIGSPAVPYSKLHLPDGELEIESPNAGGDNIHVRSLRWNDQPLETCCISHDELAQGGKLVFELSDEPTGWGGRAPDWG